MDGALLYMQPHIQCMERATPSTAAMCGRKETPLNEMSLLSFFYFFFATLCLISHFEITYTIRGENYLSNYQEIRYGPSWMTFLPCGITGIINVVQKEKELCCGFKRNNKILEPYLRTLIY